MSDPLNDTWLAKQCQPATEAHLITKATPNYYAATDAQRAKICNGAGAAWMYSLLPAFVRWFLTFAGNRLFGLDCKEAFDLHDWGYHYREKTKAAKQEEDINMLTNLFTLINEAGGCLQKPRIWLAKLYYKAVAELGYKAFFDVVE